MKKLLVNLALLSLGALAFAGATLIPPMTAQAAADAAPAPGVDWTFWIALVSAFGVFGSFALHAIAAKTHNARLEALAKEIDVLRGLLPGSKGGAQ